ncbi:hypothetical protein F5I97DRAFT_1889108 [Phlebopus sp. FC_14]|nr:hypothetical protein F5I97DRAFT_1889108 [Phlebopus sp. FC_14]
MLRASATSLPPAFAAHALQLLQKVQSGLSAVEIVYASHERWPCPPGYAASPHPPLHVSILDSSFNPPTLAHLALAKSRPPQHPTSPLPYTDSTTDYDARLLLLSIRNADKSLKPGDATYVQRLEMMHLLAQSVFSRDGAIMKDAADESLGDAIHLRGNIALAIIDQPTFVGKSTILLRFLQTRLSVLDGSSSEAANTFRVTDNVSPPKLTFILGFDTLVRLFSPKYYPSEEDMIRLLRAFLSPSAEDCRVVCARRTSAGVDPFTQAERDARTLDTAREFLSNGRIALIDIGADEQTYSSSEVRKKVATRDTSWKGLVTREMADYIIENNLYISEGT